MDSSSLYWQRAQDFFAAGLFDQATLLLDQLEQTDQFRTDALKLNGRTAQAHGDLEKAAAKFRLAVTVSPNDIEALQLLAAALLFLNRHAEALPHLQRCADINPRSAAICSNLAAAFSGLGNSTQTQKWASRSIELEDTALARTNRGRALCDLGNHTESIAQFRRAISLDPTCQPAWSNLLLALNYSDAIEPDEIYKEHLTWARTFAEPTTLTAPTPMPQPLSSGRRLRIGYISPDFRSHSVASFIEPVLLSHDQSHFEIFCYSDVRQEDDVTARLKSYAVTWRAIADRTDEALAKIIRDDHIDILFDLAGHTDGNRLLCFARKPAPIQITWMGYPATTGMSAMQYRLVDAITDPADTHSFCSEKLIRMRNSFLCYQPPAEPPEIRTSPFRKNGYITFGSFNNTVKISNTTIQIWSALLRMVPDSILRIKARQTVDEGVCQKIREGFHSNDINTNRIHFHRAALSPFEHLDFYNEIDIALDTFPYNGTTTTCEALFMGVPVITRAGDRHASRVSASLLTTVSLRKLVCRSTDEAIVVAYQLASEPGELERIRQTLRQNLLASPLCNAGGFTRSLEQILMKLWTDHAHPHAPQLDRQ